MICRFVKNVHHPRVCWRERWWRRLQHEVGCGRGREGRREDGREREREKESLCANHRRRTLSRPPSSLMTSSWPSCASESASSALSMALIVRGCGNACTCTRVGQGPSRPRISTSSQFWPENNIDTAWQRTRVCVYAPEGRGDLLFEGEGKFWFMCTGAPVVAREAF